MERSRMTQSDKILKGLTIVSLSGAQGSGKSTLGTSLANYVKTAHIETSQVVQSTLEFSMSRDDLWQTSMLTKDNPDWLASAIALKILRMKLEVKKKTFIVSGVREPEVHKGLRRLGARLHVFEITAEPTLRYQRLRDLGKVKSVQHFLDKELNEQKLGLNEVLEKQAKNTVWTQEHIKPEQVAKQIHASLREKIKWN